jgi:hypothetical protein
MLGKVFLTYNSNDGWGASTCVPFEWRHINIGYIGYEIPKGVGEDEAYKRLLELTNAMNEAGWDWDGVVTAEDDYWGFPDSLRTEDVVDFLDMVSKETSGESLTSRWDELYHMIHGPVLSR